MATQEEELIEALQKTRDWMELRTVLRLRLSGCYDRESMDAARLLRFLDKEWPAHAPPQTAEIVRLKTERIKLGLLLVKCLEGLYSLGRYCPDVVHEAEKLGLQIEEHLHG